MQIDQLTRRRVSSTQWTVNSEGSGDLCLSGFLWYLWLILEGKEAVEGEEKREQGDGCADP